MGSAIDAAALRRVMARFAEALRAHREELNSLNVFPVPDGDTGTNMLLTQEAVIRSLEPLEGASISEVGEAITHASLMGARGNSGVILSQYLRGLAGRLAANEEAGGAALADALAAGAEEATRAVARPQRGTILTVAEAAADGARAAAEEDPDAACTAVADGALRAAGAALERTPDLLPDLRRAGVVDAGGRGILLLFDALVSELTGRPPSVPVGPLGPVGRSEAAPSAPLEFDQEVMYLLEAADDAIPALRTGLSEIGDSVVVVGGGGLFNVHVHTNEADRAIEAGRAAGVPSEVRISSLQDEVDERCLAGQARAVQVAEQRVGLVAVAEGDGLEGLFRSLGAVVVPGGPGRNPSVEQLATAIRASGPGTVVVLPNHRNVIPAALRAADAAAANAEVLVVPTTSIPRGIAAAAAFNPLGDPRAVAEEMEGMAAACASGELTTAVRDAETPAGPVTAGTWLAVADGEVVSTGDDPSALASGLVTRLRRPEHEVLTLFVGADPGQEEVARVEAAVAAAGDGLEIEVHAGGQPRYPYLIGLE